MRFVILFATGVLLALVFAAPTLNTLYPDEEMGPGQSLRLVFNGDVSKYMTLKEGGLEQVWDATTGKYNFGRSLAPPKTAELHPLTAAQRLSTLKEWYWTAVASESVIVGIATVQFGYSSAALMYYYDAETGTTDKAFVDLKFAARQLGASFTNAAGDGASTLINGCSRMNAWANVSQCYEAGLIKAEAVGTFASGKTVSLAMEIELSGDTLNYVYPIGMNRPAVVSKGAGLPARATVRVGEGADAKTTEVRGMGLVDWTRSMSARHTRWYWTAFSFVHAATNTRIGFQLSSGVYDDEFGHGLENCLFINGKLTMLETRATFRVPVRDDLATKQWTLEAEYNGTRIAYTFTPKSTNHGEFHLGVLDGDLHHVWGTSTGTVTVGDTVYAFENVPGVMEDHYALW